VNPRIDGLVAGLAGALAPGDWADLAWASLDRAGLTKADARAVKALLLVGLGSMTLDELRHIRAVSAAPSSAYDDIRAERAAQIADGYTAEHDAANAAWRWIQVICLQVKLAAPLTLPGSDGQIRFRGQMVRVAALAVAAIEAVDKSRKPALATKVKP
jgi:hypothetical protein